MMYVESFEKLSGNDRFEGMAVDMAHELSLVLGFNYTLKLVDDGKVRKKKKRSGISWISLSTAVKLPLEIGMECWEKFGMENLILSLQTFPLLLPEPAHLPSLFPG